MNRRLYRSSRERVISGVAGGVAEYFDVDPSIVRIAWALLALITGGVFLILYGVMWLVVPVAPGTAGSAASSDDPSGTPGAPAPRAERYRSGSAGLVFGVILIGLGLYFLAREYLPGFNIDRLWPLGLVALGIFLLIAAMRQRPSA
jgi:phage shock protein PspC (stress-responsive transcriptional regulator)